MQITAMILFAVMFGMIMLLGVGNTKAAQDDERPNTVLVVPYGMQSTETSQTAAVKFAEVEPTPTTEAKKTYVYYDVPLDNDFQEYIQDVCEQYGFEHYDIVIALIGHESSYRQTVVSKTDDYGYMQINSINHEWLGEELGITDFLDGEQNVIAGIYLLDGLMEKYDDIGLALMCYNCGETGARNLWQQGVYSTNYSRSIIEDAANLICRNGDAEE